MKSAMDKEIIIIDAFITNKINESKLHNFIENIKKTKIPILLVSNTVISNELINNVDYYIYDSNNRLLGDNFTNIEKFILWGIIGDIKFNTFHSHTQKHALSVMVNLFNSLWFLKSLGFKYFHRIEYDTILGDKTIELIKNNLSECKKQNKKGYFILNHESQTHTFQYFLSEIDLFFKIIPEIKSEDDYIQIINKNFGTSDFIILEKIMYNLLNDNYEIKIVEWKNFEFNDSIWNTVSSDVHLEDKYKNTRTNLYLGESNNIIFSKQNIQDKSERLIELYTNGEKISQIIHRLNSQDEYSFDFIEKQINKIVVSENNNIIDIIDVKNEINFYEKIN
jgi:hypothetical protein